MLLPPPCRYMPCTEINEGLGIRPNIMIDGAARAGTVLALSHWPKSGTPDALKADTSTEIVFEYIDQPGMHEDVALITGDHFDEDASLGIFTLLEPDFASAHRALICDAARAGDFATYEDRRAARIAFSIQALGDPAYSPLANAIFEQDYNAMCADLFKEILPRLRPIIEHTEAFEELWQGEDDFLKRSEQALADGSLRIEEHPDISFAVVTVDTDLRNNGDRARARRGGLPYHPMAVHNATNCNRLLNVIGQRYVFGYRYESWVQYISSPPPERIDLHPLAANLSELEPGDATWTFDGVEAITPAMRLSKEDESAMEVADIVNRIVAFLENGDPAWDPYDRPEDKLANTSGMLALPH